MLKRREVTDWLLNYLKEEGHVVGDILAPLEGGWQKRELSEHVWDEDYEEGDDDELDFPEFVPYVVVTPLDAKPSVSANQGRYRNDWTLRYQLTWFGVSREQVENIADTARGLTEIRPEVPTDANFKINWVLTPTVGGIGYTTQLDPPGYSQSDTYELEVRMV